MKRLFMAAAALAGLIALISQSKAADMAPSYTKAAPMPAAAPFSWTGFYVGVNAGIGGDQIDYPFTAFGNRLNGNLSTQSFGGFAGGQVGWQYQFVNGVVAGLEADIQWSNIRSHIGANVNAGNNAFGLDAGTEIKWFGTARGRLGYGWDKVLLYATGGYAYGSETTSLNVNPAIFAFSRDANLSGYVVGGGVEYAFAPSWSLKTEYLFFDFGKRNVFTAPNNVFAIDNDIKMHTLKAGVNYRF